jgi:hypothetical protein
MFYELHYLLSVKKERKWYKVKGFKLNKSRTLKRLILDPALCLWQILKWEILPQRYTRVKCMKLQTVVVVFQSMGYVLILTWKDWVKPSGSPVWIAFLLSHFYELHNLNILQMITWYKESSAYLSWLSKIIPY